MGYGRYAFATFFEINLLVNDVLNEFWLSGLAPELCFSIAGVAPLASYSLSAATKSNQKRPPRQLRPVKGTGFPFNRNGYHAAPELANNAQTCWCRKPMIITPLKRLAKVDWKSKARSITLVKSYSGFILLVLDLLSTFRRAVGVV